MIILALILLMKGVNRDLTKLVKLIFSKLQGSNTRELHL